jgi:hypothetical protein
MFPISGAVTRPLPSLLTGSSGMSYPAFNGTMKRLRLPASISHAPSPSRADTTSLTLTVRSRGRQGSRPQAWSLVSRFAPSGISGWRRRDLPSSQEAPLHICPAPRPRQDRIHQAIAMVQCCPRYFHDEGSCDAMFRGSLTELLCPLSTLRAAITDDYARLASGWRLPVTGWDWLPTGLR